MNRSSCSSPRPSCIFLLLANIRSVAERKRFECLRPNRRLDDRSRRSIDRPSRTSCHFARKDREPKSRACCRHSLLGPANKMERVTGGSRGIGEAIAHAFADAGAKVVLAARKLEGVQAVASAINDKHPERAFAI